jgi:hypothetical protein
MSARNLAWERGWHICLTTSTSSVISLRGKFWASISYDSIDLHACYRDSFAFLLIGNFISSGFVLYSPICVCTQFTPPVVPRKPLVFLVGLGVRLNPLGM